MPCDIDIRLPFWVAGGLALLNAAYGMFVLPESLPPERRAKAYDWKRANPLGALRLLRSRLGLLPLAGVGLGFEAWSAALEVAIGGAFNPVSGLALTPAQIALFGQQAENQFMNCQCGIMDQMISAQATAGHALLLDCATLATRAVAIPPELALVIVNSNYPRKLVDSEYNGRRQDCEQAAAIMGVSTLRDASMDLLQQHKNAMTAQQYKRAHHVISENARVLATVDALQQSDMTQLRLLMQASHQSLRDDFEVTVPATDGLGEICQTALGSKGAVRMTGGGFGGAIICLCAQQDVVLVEQAVAAHYQARFGLKADVYVCQAGAGLTVQTFAA